MSEATDPTAGEREPFYWDATTGEPCPREGNVLCALPWRDEHRHTHTPPVTPDAGEVETLREALCFCDDVHDCQTTEDSDRLKAACERNVQRVTARLDAVRRKAGDERAEEIAQAIEAHAEAHLPTWLRSNYENAASIARESR